MRKEHGKWSQTHHKRTERKQTPVVDGPTVVPQEWRDYETEEIVEGRDESCLLAR